MYYNLIILNTLEKVKNLWRTLKQHYRISPILRENISMDMGRSLSAFEIDHR